jgi:DNA-binding transcriptional LysR family regulator
MPLGEQLEALESGAIQIGFTVGGGPPLPASLQQVEVARSPIRAVVGRGHRLARQARVALADLVREPLVCFSIKKGAVSPHGEIMRRKLEARGFKTGAIRAIEGAEAFRATLESGLGVSLIAEIGSLARSQDLAFRPLKETGDDLVMELNAVWSRGQSSQIAANFIELLKRAKLPGGIAARRRPAR